MAFQRLFPFCVFLTILPQTLLQPDSLQKWFRSDRNLTVNWILEPKGVCVCAKNDYWMLVAIVAMAAFVFSFTAFLITAVLYYRSAREQVQLIGQGRADWEALVPTNGRRDANNNLWPIATSRHGPLPDLY